MAELKVSKVIISPSPHFHANINPDRIMNRVILSLVPASLAAFYFFGWISFLKIVGLSVASAVFFEFIILRLFKRKPLPGTYSSSIVTGLLLALTLPPTSPWWIPIVGSAIAIIVAKEFFGGLGHNPFNPALVGRAVLLISWPTHLTTFIQPFSGITTATPLAFFRDNLSLPSYQDLFLGNIAGSLGETSAIALIIGGLFLLLSRTIEWQIPTAFLGSVAILSLTLGRDPVFDLLSGGILMGAFFMATDYVTSPITPWGRLLFGIGCGLLTITIRAFGGYPEGVTYAILIMNAFAPMLEQATLPRKFGTVHK
ncbi:MAG: Electron transport complex subunit RsxD [candidate division WS2 bacterium]|nr:Electron transport complex subunit RsxD [Candidatus Lithacetigena glycinireducens]MBT9174473.1 Electron transport complex subunit RsxD [Candidatus Lithacetigena glycinireducens]